MADIFNMTDTWNDGATVFNAIKMAVTNTASNAASKLIDIQDVTNGTGLITDAATGKTTIKLAGGKTIIFEDGGLPSINVSTSAYLKVGGATPFRLRSTDFTMVGSVPLAWASSPFTADLFLYQDAANELALRNGLNAQSFSVYNTYTSSSVYERMRMYWNSNVARLSVGHQGSTYRSFILDSHGANVFRTFSGKVVYYQNITSFGNVDLGGPGEEFGDVYLHPSASLTPNANGDLCIEATDNTTLTFKYKGSDGTVRSGTVALS